MFDNSSTIFCISLQVTRNESDGWHEISTINYKHDNQHKMQRTKLNKICEM